MHIIQTRSLSPKFNNKINHFEYLQPKADCTTFGRRIFGLATYATSNLRWKKKIFLHFRGGSSGNYLNISQNYHRNKIRRIQKSI